MRKKQYSSDDLDKAIQMYLDGTKLSLLVKKYPNTPKRTITERTKKKRENVELKKPGPSALLNDSMENDIQAWIVGMQSHGHPVTRGMVLVKGNEIYRKLYGTTRSTGFLGRGWLERFMGRHPLLGLRKPHSSRGFEQRQAKRVCWFSSGSC